MPTYLTTDTRAVVVSRIGSGGYAPFPHGVCVSLTMFSFPPWLWPSHRRPKLNIVISRPPARCLETEYRYWPAHVVLWDRHVLVVIRR